MYTGNKENAPERNKTVESRQRKVMRKDVAEEAGVSETIVSYVLNKNRYVKEEKRQRVLEAVESYSISLIILPGLFTERAVCKFFLLQKN